MIFIFLLGLKIDQYIINKHNHQSIQHQPANTVHQVHEHWRCISESKWHQHELVVYVTNSQGRLLNIHIPIVNTNPMRPIFILYRQNGSSPTITTRLDELLVQ